MACYGRSTVAIRPVKVSSSPPEADSPKLMQVGIIAAACFAVGALWPTLSGLQLVPEVPTKKAAPPVTPRPARSSDEPPSTREVPVSGLALNDAPELQAQQGDGLATITKELVVNCHDGEDRRLSQCDKPAFERVAGDRLRALATCEPARGLSGTLSIGFDLDFQKEKIVRILKGKSTTFNDDVAEGLVACAKREFMSATLRGVEHTHARYLVFYMVELVPPGLVGTDPSESSVIPTSGTGTVVWNSARIRSEPVDGDVRARILYGTRVVITGRQEDWYRVRYDAQGNEGWVHKNALAM